MVISDRLFDTDALCLLLNKARSTASATDIMAFSHRGRHLTGPKALNLYNSIPQKSVFAVWNLLIILQIEKNRRSTAPIIRMKRYNIINNAMGWLCFLIAAVTYLLTIEPTASFWDCPEFILQDSNSK